MTFNLKDRSSRNWQAHLQMSKPDTACQGSGLAWSPSQAAEACCLAAYAARAIRALASPTPELSGDAHACCAASLEALALSVCLPSLEEQLEGHLCAPLADPLCTASTMDALVMRLQTTLAFQQRLLRLIPAKAGLPEATGPPAAMRSSIGFQQPLCMQAVLA